MPRYVSCYTPAQRRVLSVLPGITDPATLRFRGEEALLAQVKPEEREDFYLREVLPRKLEINLEYLERAGFWADLGVLARTLGALVGAGGKPSGGGGPQMPGATTDST